MSNGTSELLDEWFVKTVKYISIRPRSEKELRDYVEKKQVPLQVVGPLFEKLISLKLLDDEAFVSWWIDQRNTFRPRSSLQLRDELTRKGISRVLIDSALLGYKSNQNELDMAMRLAKKKLRLLGNIGSQEKRLKLMQFLMRKGFEWHIIEKVTKQSIDLTHNTRQGKIVQKL